VVILTIFTSEIQQITSAINGLEIGTNREDYCVEINFAPESNLVEQSCVKGI